MRQIRTRMDRKSDYYNFKVSENEAKHQLAEAVEAGECYPGIAICGSGEGISMTLNKHQGIRAALCWMPEIAHMTRLHNDANVLVMPGRYISTETASEIMNEFFNTEFEGGRHQNRINKIPVK